MVPAVFLAPNDRGTTVDAPKEVKEQKEAVKPMEATKNKHLGSVQSGVARL